MQTPQDTYREFVFSVFSEPEVPHWSKARQKAITEAAHVAGSAGDIDRLLNETKEGPLS